MKKIYTFFFWLLLPAAILAQFDVTFAVNMTGLVVSPDGVHIAGNFQDVDGDGNFENPDLVNWSPNTYELTDPNFDLVYTITLQLVEARYEFKFINDDEWAGAEDVPPACQVEVAGNDNRVIWLEYPITYSVCFGSCAPCNQKTVRFRVDMSNEGGGSADGVHVAGDFQDPGGTTGDWDASTFQIIDPDGDNIFEGWYNIQNMSSFEYKFINADTWDTDMAENFTEGDCLTAGDNRFELIADLNTVLPVYCFNSCDPCSEPVNITFQVDMNTTCMDYDTEGVNLMGTVSNWGDGTPMDDSDNDNIYTLTLALQPGDYEYKFRVGGGGWEGGGNRPLTVVESTPEVLPAVCFGSTEPCGAAFPAADVTFEVKETAALPVEAGHSMWLIGDFTNWQGGAVEMTDDDNDDIWTHTEEDFCPQNAFFKFAVGLDTLNTTVEWTEESADFSAIGGCGVDNGTFSDNRYVERTSADPVYLCYIFDTCEPCIISVQENGVVNSLNVYPVPAKDLLNISFTSAYNSLMELAIVNQLGQRVAVKKLTATQGLQTIIMNVEELASGIYTLEISNGTSVQSQMIAIR